ncbi:MAG TPA: DUF523 and DUF1722 domain-containing protein [Cellvibrionaceae bacterium]
MSSINKIPVGISQCLLGEPVRFDGGHKRSRFITDELSRYFSFEAHCPEVAIGLGIPRKPIQLVATDSGTRVLQSDNHSVDVTEPLQGYARSVTPALAQLCGYIFMQKSPSCGLYGMKRYGSNGYPLDTKGRGAYAAEVLNALPLLPVEEAGRLNDAALRENFITRVFAYHDWRKQVEAAPSAQKLIAFYSRYKYQVMAHHVPSYKAIGRLLADMKKSPIEQICKDFIHLFMGALSHLASRKGNTNVMQHLQGYLKNLLTSAEKQELQNLIDNYRTGMLPLIVPVTLLRHHLLKTEDSYLQQQTFWSPHPERLGLRNATLPH